MYLTGWWGTNITVQKTWRLLPFGWWLCVVLWKCTGISEETAASIIRVDEWYTSQRLYGITSQKTVVLTVITMETSNCWYKKPVRRLRFTAEEEENEEEENKEKENEEETCVCKNLHLQLEMKMETYFLDMTPCNVVKCYQHLKKICCLYLQHR